MERNNQDPDSEKELLIDIERVFASKNPALLKIIPGFIVRYLKRITHQDEINQFIHSNRNKKGLEFSRAILDGFGVDYNTQGLDQIPSSGRYLFASNHPLGGMDGIAFLSAVGERFPNLKFPVNDILMNIKGLDNIFLPLNKHGAHSREAAIALEEAYASEAQILMFPAGLVSRKQKGIIRDLEWKKNFVRKAIQHQRDVVPVHITGRNTNFFYKLANIRKRLGIKANIEMLYLADEFYKQRGENLTIRFGTPISWKNLKNEANPTQSAEKIKKMVYELPKIN
ncbi:1-acyl-sn-glycerol-3-phosphate acyltransferase [Alkalitalea saponilacus]|uniref:Acyltransferase n=1 Tax=Alkalitalea saponilacus TaxID=889453 RepID=A0A1T5HR13_9BACT|nr:1-acyl-sn-glycerol-3-phosphate acyltransferase [Alkalitalea saponilacus]ASB48402.1 glycerol acyltransferase [Alkalitalea saponilacus]SKC23082.1 Acyltransferase [Alkalitalea saponilacus]